MSNSFKNKLFLAILLTFMPAVILLAQSEDSLLQKINNIDIALDTPPDSIENFYLNTVSFQSFYDLLSPVGEWIQISKEEVDEEIGDGNGQSFASNTEDNTVFIWRPSGTVNSWQPYSDGKWIFTSHGWVWQGNEHWGWAVYHYGRWWNSPKHGWVWMPGYVWSPAWVMWRVDDSHVGWSPLSPRAKWKSEIGITETNYKYKGNDADWVFVNKSGFADDIGSSTIISKDMNTGLVAGSKTILDIKTENDAVINRGPEKTDIEKAAGKTIRERKLKFVNDRNKAGISENEISVYKEHVKKYKSRDEKKKNSKVERPKKFKRTEKVKRIIKHRGKEHRIRIRHPRQ